MSQTWDKALSLLIAVAAVTITGLVARREFFAAPRSLDQTSSQPEFVQGWQEMLPGSRLIGDSAAPVQIVEFGDLECPFCGKFNGTLVRIRERYPRDVAIRFVHLPLSNHRFARPAARAAECAVPDGRFFHMIDAIYGNQDSLGLKSWVAFASEAGVRDTATFARCVASNAPLPIVEAGIEMAGKFAIRGTPTVFLNGWRFAAPPSDSMIEHGIRNVLARRRPYGG